MRGLALKDAKRASGNLEKFFPEREEFQSRHIGPREHDQVDMLKTLGFQVNECLNNKEMRKSYKFFNLTYSPNYLRTH